ncbi:MAG: DUF2244 domain-containing protein [Geminicoccaceae bacterium]
MCAYIVAMTESVSTTASSMPADFQVVLYPNRSLGGKGFALLMGLVVLVSVLVGAGFVLVGAWPVTGFLGLDVLLIYLAFRWNFHDSSRVDFIRLDDDRLTVRRIMPNGEAREWHFETAWVQVVIEKKRLLLRSHGQALAIGPYLTSAERSSLGEALRQAIQARRNMLPTP